VDTALHGGRPDRVPIFPIYDIGYVARLSGLDVRSYLFCTPTERLGLLETAFLRHRVDGFFCHTGISESVLAEHQVEKHADYWLITHQPTGHRFRLLPDGTHATPDGQPIVHHPVTASGESRIRNMADLDRAVPPPAPAAMDRTNRMDAIRHLSAKYPDHPFAFQTGTAMVQALNTCGGYAEGLSTLAESPDLFNELLRRLNDHTLAWIPRGKAAGAHSMWFTSYYTGADTISPRTYAEMIFPHDYAVCQAARDAGLFVLHWWLGDLMPVLDQVMKLPMDALVLEQGRKGYESDPVAIRRRVGDAFCLFGYGYENDYCEDHRAGLAAEFRRQFEGAGRQGAFVAGTPILPPNSVPEAVDAYFETVRHVGVYS
jgi:hypothetical protein